MTTQETTATSRVVRGTGLRRAMRPVEDRDDTTRYLCAAAHLDEEFANETIREFLVEDTRPVPPSAGVDAAAVLGEAVAARTRRKLRDIGVIVLLIGMLFVVPVEMLGGWLALAVIFSLSTIRTAARKRGLPATTSLYVAAGVGLVAVVAFMWPEIEDLVSEISGSAYSYEPPPSRTEVIVDIVLTVVGVAALLTVLLADRLVVWKHLNERFWPHRRPGTLARTRDRAVFQFSPDLFLTQLRRYVAPQTTIAAPYGSPDAEPTPLLVYRDFVPFVGAGTPEDAWSIAVPLERLPDVTSTTELTTDALYAVIRTEIESLRGALELAPSQRLRQLNFSERVVVSADELIDHLDDQAAEDFLAEPGVAPFTALRSDRTQSIKAEPMEWARYYQCYEIETWDRDIVMSAFVHVAVGTDALYVEWTPCVLRPIKRKYREIDTMSRSLWRPLLHAVADLLRLPVTIPARLAHTFSFIRPARQHHGVVDPNSYGVATSLRELAAAQHVDNYFQVSDIDRYLKVMESRLFLAVSRMMRAAGYSPASFEEQASTVVNNNVTIGGNVGGNFVAGTRNNVGETPAKKPDRR